MIVWIVGVWCVFIGDVDCVFCGCVDFLFLVVLLVLCVECDG